ncbi:MAG: N-acetyltransferase [Bacteroidales bacterium]|nr:N-acetyltransferase [Bacteroidales bacterium]
MKARLGIRFAKKDDLPSIVDIYNQAIRSKRATGDLIEFDVSQRVDWFDKFDSEIYPIYIAELEGKVVGYCTISPYRPGREAMSSVAEISYYIDYSYHNKGIGFEMLDYAIGDCGRIGKESLLAILLDINQESVRILEKFGFKKWGYLPDIINIDGAKCGHLIYGLKI